MVDEITLLNGFVKKTSGKEGIKMVKATIYSTSGDDKRVVLDIHMRSSLK